MLFGRAYTSLEHQMPMPSDLEQTEKELDLLQPYLADQTHQAIWKGLNFATCAGLTSLAVVLAQSPVKTVLLSINKDGTLLPQISGGSLSVFRFLYRGTSMSLLGSVLRTTWFTGTKDDTDNQTVDIPFRIRFGYVMIISLGDIFVTQIHESLSQLQKIDNRLPADFTWRTPRNALQLMFGGFAPRYLSGIINFTAICLLEDKIARCMPLRMRSDVNHLVAGALSGMVAAFFSYPMSSLKDTILLQSVVHDGKLFIPNTASVLKAIRQDYQTNPHKWLNDAWQKGKVALPARMALSGVIFSIVAFMGEALGKEPLNALMFKSYQPYRQTNSFGFFAPRLSPTLKASASDASHQEVIMPELFL